MNSTGSSSSPFYSFKSNKPLRSSVNKSHSSGNYPPRKTIITNPNPSELLPEKFEILDKFFNSLMCATRLLRLKGSTCTFTNISRKIEILTNRKFYYTHLAQLKFVLPEAIEIKKILVRDDVTCCMKRDLHVDLNFSVIQNDEKLKSDSMNLETRKLFRARLVSFCKSNPKGGEVPMDELPEPFNQSSQLTSSPATEKPNLGSVENMACTDSEYRPVVASHIPQSFKRRFSKQVSTHNAETIEQESRVLIRKVTCKLNTPPPVERSFKRRFSKHISTHNAETIEQEAMAFIHNVTCVLKTPSPVKWSPKLPPPIKRPIIVHPPVENKTSILERIKETERKPATSEAKWREKMITGLPKLFNIILFFFQSINRSFVTKEELMHIIISNHLDIDHRSEAEDQLGLLQELVPEWIYEKTTSSGDLLLCINKIPSTELMHKKLSEAVTILSALYLV